MNNFNNEGEETQVSAQELASNKDVVAALSSAFEDVLFSDESAKDFRRFDSRLKSASKNRNSETDGFVNRINQMHEAKEMNSLLQSPSGLKSIIAIKDISEFRTYCEILDFQMDELDSILNACKSPTVGISKYSTVLALGLWVQNILESEKEGKTIESDKKSMIKKSIDEMGKMESFRTGRKMAHGLWNNVVASHKRGRRSTVETEQSFDFEKDSSK